MKEQLARMKEEFLSSLKDVADRTGLDELEQRFFSRKNGIFSGLLKGVKDLADDAKKEFGALSNEYKKEFEALLEERKQALEQEKFANLAQNERIDITAQMASATPIGHLHPITKVRSELEDIARSMGFLIEDGPELESDYYVFESLNIPKSHPARDTQDTFYIKDHPEWCMRTHVSNMQVRLMRKYGAPLRAAHPGRVFRNEAIDATHGHTFYQFDAIVVDKDLSIADLIGTAKAFLKGLYKRDVEVRLRPGHFPFVEPGFEMDMKISYTVQGEQKEKWMEIFGCGMIHPYVLQEGGIDPNLYNGFAFSFGIDRLTFMRYGLQDIRHIHSADLRFLTQF